VADSLRQADVEPLLRGRFGRPYLHAEACRSTQRLLPADAPEGAVAVADHQTEGRGRHGRTWTDEAGTSLLLSLVLRPRVPASRLPELTLVAAEACRAAVEAVTGLEATVKDPNDVLVDGRKVAGVLGEAAGERVVLGVGVNVNQQPGHLPGETRLPPTSLRIELGRAVPRAELLAELLLRLERGYDAWVVGTLSEGGAAGG
jgi:BirA family transcriptional regulator, biotin operon repressor / biotin---[acetyl-CoA-carboxylase] ligase